MTWSVGGSPAATGCSAAGAVAVEVQFLALADSSPGIVMCANGQETCHATLFGPTGMGPSAGSLKLRLLDGAGGELSAIRLPLVWDQGSVSATANFALASPGGAVRYRWCQALPAGGTLTVTANGPMWRERVAAAPATELLISGLAAGRYELSAAQGGGQTGIGPAAAWVDVVDGGETLLSVVPCPP